MTTCRKCGLPLAFKELPNGSMCPTNPDGSDHWDLCRETWLAAMTPEERKAHDAKDKKLKKPVTTKRTNMTLPTGGEGPPWRH